MEQFRQILEKPFVKELQAFGGQIYFVGGAVRDYIRGVEPNDIDLVVRNIDPVLLKEILFKFGLIDLVGQSFGVFIFAERGTGFKCEIALPRRDSKVEDAVDRKTAIEVQSDPSLDIQDDLLRRDFTCNSIAIDQELKVIDPFNGLRDIAKKFVVPTSVETFMDDPLRLIRAVRFAAQLDFRLHEGCLMDITWNSHLIRKVSPERILQEFEKVVAKESNVWTFLTHMCNHTQMYQQAFGIKPNNEFTLEDTLHVKTVPEMLYLTLRGENPPINRWGDHFKIKMKLSSDQVKELNSFEWLNTAKNDNVTSHDNRMTIFKVMKYTPQLFDSHFMTLPGVDRHEFEIGRYPKTMADLDVTSDELMKKLGLEPGKAFGELKNALVYAVMQDRVENTKSKLIRFAKTVYVKE